MLGATESNSNNKSVKDLGFGFLSLPKAVFDQYEIMDSSLKTDILPNIDFAEDFHAPLTMNLHLFDFSRDLTVSDELSLGPSYHNALKSLPLRDRIADSLMPKSPDHSEEDVISTPRSLEKYNAQLCVRSCMPTDCQRPRMRHAF